MRVHSAIFDIVTVVGMMMVVVVDCLNVQESEKSLQEQKPFKNPFYYKYIELSHAIL